MCPPKQPKIQKADPVQAASPPVDMPQAPVLNEVGATGSDADIANAAAKRKGKKSLINTLTTTPTTGRPQIGVNVPI
jgi:succinylarginine dihydrolase